MCEAKKQLWLATRNKTKIYLKVTEKYIVEEKLVLQKNEQKLADEFNQSLFYRRMSKADHNSNS
ncbi:hypothetical protein [sulfur-oxidizing endosymbiont of Gigantopelta aegis]|uniref:hypothetical protein n=1 Tax=sulfur-oxidizing endosymbiont of Gigantopelta aegis TaxID=2794934 RepID=UPI0018DC5B45|nr:hypothetical protein [sulfur-oxidizing endosymbiont of Gigantopelta aegis]